MLIKMPEQNPEEQARIRESMNADLETRIVGFNPEQQKALRLFGMQFIEARIRGDACEMVEALGMYELKEREFYDLNGTTKEPEYHPRMYFDDEFQATG